MTSRVVLFVLLCSAVPAIAQRREHAAQSPDFVEEAKMLYTIKDYTRALEVLDQAIASNPDWTSAYNLRGVTLMALQNLNMAIQDFSKAIALFPRYIEAFNNRGMALNLQGEYNKAIEDFSHCLAISVADREVYYFNRAGCQYALGHYKEAIADYGESVRINPGFTSGYMNRALLEESMGNFKGAEDDFRQCVRWNPQDARAFLELGVLEEQYLNNLTEASKAFDAAIKLDPSFSDAYNDRGTVEMRQAHYRPAIRDFNRAIDLDQTNPDFYFNRGITHQAMGKTRHACTDLRTAAGKGSSQAGAALARYCH